MTEESIQGIQSMIYEVRGCRVMLDRDLATLYGVETRRLNEAVKRNIKRFPNDFMFQLTREEAQNLMSQIATSSLKSQIVMSKHGGSRKLPYAFTEQGVAMLSGLLNSDTAITVNISIMRTFVAIRHALATKTTGRYVEQHELDKLKAYIEDVFTDYNDINEDTRLQLELINQSLAELQATKCTTHKPRRKIGYIQQADEE